MIRHGLRFGALLGAFVLLAGCNDRGVQTVPVRGKITYGGGTWPKAGTLYFMPIHSTGAIMRPGMASFSTDGTFSAQTFEEGDGLIPGRYVVKVECWENPPTLNPNAPEAKSYVPLDIQTGQAEGWQVEVPSDQALVELSLNVPKT